MREIINISLPKEMKERVDKAVKVGNFASRSEYVRDVLRDRINKDAPRPAPTFEEIVKTARPILKKAGIKKAALFGSAARGELGPESDIDFLIDASEGMDLFDVVGLQLDLQDTFFRDVDVITYGGIHPLLREEILSSQKKIEL